MMSFQSFATVSVSAVKALRRVIPALLTRIETCPILSATCPANAKQSSRLVTSSAKLSALPPDVRISCAASATVSALTSSSTTCAPSRA